MSIDPRVAKALRRAAVRATRAPSVRNTQPWRLVLHADSLEVQADRSRQLTVLDPHGRQLLISCGCAVFNARVSMAASDVGTQVEYLVDADRGSALARLSGGDAVETDIAHLDPSIEIRQTNRRPFTREPVPDAVSDTLVAAAAAEGCELVPFVREDHKETVAKLIELAERTLSANPAFDAESRRWTSDDPGRVDGVPTPTAADSVPAGEQCLFVLGTRDDGPAAWLRAGQALERVLLEVASAGFTARPLIAAIEVACTYDTLRDDLGLTVHPHLLLRVGRARSAPATRRRRLVEVIFDGA
jgi:nitroreductase